MNLRDLARAGAWLLPASTGKNALLRRLGHEVATTAVARSNLVWQVDRITLGPNSRLGRWNLIKHLATVELAEGSSVGRLNVMSAHPVYRRLVPGGASLRLGPGAKVTSRHQLDCSALIDVGGFASIAGHGTLVLTHGVDLKRDAQSAAPVRIGHHSLVGARCVVLGGAVLPERSVLGAGAVLTRSRSEARPGLWAGSPARWRAEMQGAWFERQETHTRRLLLPDSGDVVENAF